MLFIDEAHALPRHAAMLSLPRFMVAVSFLTLLAACTSNPSAEEVVDQSTPVICEKVKECRGELAFSMAYPGGIDECVSRTKAEVQKKYGDDLEASSVCTDEELEKCISDLRAAPCPADGSAPPVPCNC